MTASGAHRGLRVFATVLVGGTIALAYLLQPARSIGWILSRAGRALHLDLHTTAPGSYSLIPEVDLRLPGLSASLAGDRTPFFRSRGVEVEVPWSTLLGRGKGIDTIVLDSPAVDLQGLQSWKATLPPSNEPFKFPRLLHGLTVRNGSLSGNHWQVEHLDVALPSLADGAPATVAANGELVASASVSKFALTLASTPAGTGLGLRLDDARVVLQSTGELPSLVANGHLLITNNFEFDLKGTMQRMPAFWSAAFDSGFAKRSDIPFAVSASDDAPTKSASNPFAVLVDRQALQLKLSLGDAERPPAISIDAQASTGAIIDATVKGQFSRWPDAWPGLPAAVPAVEGPVLLDASYQGPVFMTQPINYDVTRANTTVQGRLGISDLIAWIRGKFGGSTLPHASPVGARQGSELNRAVQHARDHLVAVSRP